MGEHEFGGDWTDEKLSRLRKYLAAYTRIMTRNSRARYFTTTYVDAFAGTGTRKDRRDVQQPEDASLFEGQDPYDDADGSSLRQGSAAIALGTEPRFDHYIFIEKNKEYRRELTKLRQLHPERARNIQISKGGANQFLQEWCHTKDWGKNRAVVFLDPYGMEVEWKTLEAIAATEAIDLWTLFPLGQAVNRLLTRKELPPNKWQQKLTAFFGSDEWKDRFYRAPSQMSLFQPGAASGDREQSLERFGNLEEVGKYFLERLDSVFTKVSPRALPLVNSRQVPIYLLCFAAGAPRGAEIAVKIAKDLLRP